MPPATGMGNTALRLLMQRYPILSDVLGQVGAEVPEEDDLKNGLHWFMLILAQHHLVGNNGNPVQYAAILILL